MSHILIADDEVALRRFLERFLGAQGHSIELVECGEAALEAARARRPDLVLLDVQMPGIGGLETLERMGRDLPGVPVVIMTATGTIETAVRAFKLGAVDFVQKPFDNAKLLAAVDAVIATRASQVEVRGPTMIGESPRFREVMDLAHRFARPDINILLQGETGTGKELFARYIHESSKRKDGPFIPVDCSILSEHLIESELFGHEKGAFTGATGQHIGHFERANQGTLFLDEIGNLRLDTQAKLLRVLQERKMERVGGREPIQLDIRVISATNVNLKDAVERRIFRQDLYFRLQEMVLVTPPLRERAGDVRRLAQYFLQRYASRWELAARELTPEAIAELEAYAWPGNVRELENVIKAAVIHADDRVLPKHLPKGVGGEATPLTLPSATVSSSESAVSNGASSPSGRERFRMEIDFGTEVDGLDLKLLAKAAAEKAEATVLRALVDRERTTITQLAKVVNLDQKTLREKLKKYGIDL